LWVGLQPDAFCLDAANPVGLKVDPQGPRAMLWVGLQPDAFCLAAANPVGLKADPQ